MSDRRLPEDDAAFDALFAALPVAPPPQHLSDQTLAAVAAERPPHAANRPFPRWWLLAAAAAALLSVPFLPTAPPESSTLVEKGVGDPVAALALRVAVRTSSSVERFNPDLRYAAGDTLVFRVSLAAPMTLSLARDTDVLWTGALSAGTHDLPVGYTIEAGQPTATFTVSGSGATESVTVRGPR